MCLLNNGFIEVCFATKKSLIQKPPIIQKHTRYNNNLTTTMLSLLYPSSKGVEKINFNRLDHAMNNLRKRPDIN